MPIRADTHVPGPPYCTYGLRVPASSVLYVPEAQGSLPRAPLLYVCCMHNSLRACCAYRVLWHQPRCEQRVAPAR